MPKCMCDESHCHKGEHLWEHDAAAAIDRAAAEEE